jgi:hypothetical protein
MPPGDPRGQYQAGLIRRAREHDARAAALSCVIERLSGFRHIALLTSSSAAIVPMLMKTWAITDQFGNSTRGMR